MAAAFGTFLQRPLEMFPSPILLKNIRHGVLHLNRSHREYSTRAASGRRAIQQKMGKILREIKEQRVLTSLLEIKQKSGVKNKKIDIGVTRQDLLSESHWDVQQYPTPMLLHFLRKIVDA